MAKFFQRKKKTEVAKVEKKIKKDKNQKKETKTPVEEEKQSPQSKIVNSKKMVYFGRNNGVPIKKQMEKVWGKTAQKLMQLSPEELQKEIKDCEYNSYQKNQLGTMLHGLIKKELQIGKKSDKYIYNEAQQKKYDTAYQKATKMTIKQMQEILKKNDQVISDKKEKIIERFADGETLGRIPRCPICYGGKLKFSNKTGIYICPGYVDGGDNCVKGDDYIFCNNRFKINEITRLPWE